MRFGVFLSFIEEEKKAYGSNCRIKFDTLKQWVKLQDGRNDILFNFVVQFEA